MGMAMGGMIAGASAGATHAHLEAEQARRQADYDRDVNLYNATVARNNAIEQMNQENYQADLRKRDSTIAGINAEIAEQSAGRAEADQRRKGRRFLGAAKAAGGASGFDVTQGSSMYAMLENTRLAEYDANVAGYGLRMDAWKSKDDAKMLMNEAENHAQRAKYLKDFGIAAAGAQYDAMAEYNGRMRDYYDNSWAFHVALGALGGAFGQSHSAYVKKEVKGDPNATLNPVPYDADRNSMTSDERDTANRESLQSGALSGSGRTSGGGESDSSEGSIGTLGGTPNARGDY